MQVRKKDTGRIYAMKTIRKAHIVSRSEVTHTLAERTVLGQVNNPFIVPLKFSFQNAEKLYLVLSSVRSPLLVPSLRFDWKRERAKLVWMCLSCINGGELFHHLQKEGRFSEERARLYAAELLCALEHLHAYDVIYRYVTVFFEQFVNQNLLMKRLPTVISSQRTFYSTTRVTLHSAILDYANWTWASPRRLTVSPPTTTFFLYQPDHLVWRDSFLRDAWIPFPGIVTRGRVLQDGGLVDVGCVGLWNAVRSTSVSVLGMVFSSQFQARDGSQVHISQVLWWKCQWCVALLSHLVKWGSAGVSDTSPW